MSKWDVHWIIWCFSPCFSFHVREKISFVRSEVFTALCIQLLVFWLWYHATLSWKMQTACSTSMLVFINTTTHHDTRRLPYELYFWLQTLYATLVVQVFIQSGEWKQDREAKIQKILAGKRNAINILMHFLKTKLSPYVFNHALSTNSMQHSPSTKANSPQLVKKLPTLCETCRFATTAACCWYLSWAKTIPSKPSHPIPWRPIVILSSHLCVRLQSGLFLPYMPHAPLITFFLIDHPKNICRGILIMKLLILQSPPVSCHLTPRKPKYLTQHTTLKHPQLRFCPQCERPSFTSIQKNR